MTGRWPYVSDSTNQCADTLQRLRVILIAADAIPQAVARLPDRSSQILGTAAAAILGVPVSNFNPRQPTPHTLVVGYDLTRSDLDAVTALRQRAPGQVLFERATCWTDPPRVTADVSGLLAQVITPPWDGQLCRLEDGTMGQGPADDRPAEAIAADIAQSVPQRDEGGGSAPSDPEDNLRHFTKTLASPDTVERGGGWLGGVREYIPHAGPVPSSRFS